MGLMHMAAALVGLLAQSGFDPGPVFLPAMGAQDIAQGEHGIDMRLGPMHPCAFQAGMHHQLVAALHHAAANWPTLCLKERVLHLCFPFFQVSQVAGDGFCCGMSAMEFFKLPQQLVWSFLFQAL